MKKILAILSMLIIFSTGCGAASTAADDTKKNFEVQEKTLSELIQGVEKKFSLGGVVPSMTLAEVKAVLGEPVSKHDEDEYIFANGIVVEVTDIGNFVEEIKTSEARCQTGAGIAVGMTEKNLVDVYGQADKIEKDDGKVEYKYYSEDKTIKIEFEMRNGIISEIKVQLDD